MAKAVRIRIRSGNEEHTSLDSLLRNFNIKDVLELLDGRIDEDGKYIESRLERWLKQIHENDKAMRIHNFNQSEDMLSTCLELIQIFFPEFSSTTDIHQVAEKWVVDSTLSNNGKNLYCFLAQHGDSQAALYLFNNNILPDNVHLFDLLSEEQGEKDPTGDIEYVLGICYFEGKGVSKDIEKGHQLILKAYHKKNEKAMDFEMERRYDKAKEVNILYKEDLSNNPYYLNFNKYYNDACSFQNNALGSTKDYHKWTTNFNNWSLNSYILLSKIFDQSIMLDFIIACKKIIINNITISYSIKEMLNESIKERFNNIDNFSKFIIQLCDNSHTNYPNLDIDFYPASYLFHINDENKDTITSKYKEFSLLSKFHFEDLNYQNKICFLIIHFFDFQS